MGVSDGSRPVRPDDVGDATSPTATPHQLGADSETGTRPLRSAGAAKTASAADGQLTPGTLVDHFAVVRPLGRGAMGEVYLARDTKLGRKVALKLVHPELLGSARAVARFIDEARLTAKFDHPNIVTIHAVGEHRGRPYVALAYLEGDSLRQRCRERAPSIQEAMRYGRSIAEGLAEAHRHGVLHRDLKPANVVIGRDGRLRVVDFGLARVFAEADALPSSVRLSGGQEVAGRKPPSTVGTPSDETDWSAGTPAYMAPEQWRAQPCSGATDVWSLGIMLFEMIAGRRPFVGDTYADVAYAVTLGDSAPTLADRGDVPQALATLIERCLDRDPGRRPAAGEVAAELGKLLRTGHRGAASTSRPFVGLLPFSEDQAELFFGRDLEVAEVLERLREHPILPIVAPSGAGKTSFVRAGLVPRLREQQAWIVLHLRPGPRPFSALATRLDAALEAATSSVSASAEVQTAAVIGDPTTRTVAVNGGDRGDAKQCHQRTATVAACRIEKLAQALRAQPLRLSLELRSLAARRGAPVLLCVDPLEEIFTVVEDEDERQQFLRAIFSAADDATDPVRVVVVARDDYLGRLAIGAEAAVTLQHVTVLRRLDERALRETLTRPLHELGYRFESTRMVDKMVDAVRHQPAGLPLLQFAAQLLWEQRDPERRVLRQDAYAAIGGVEGALARHADGMLQGLSKLEQAAARRLLLRLVTPERTRRAQTRSELLHGLANGSNEGGCAPFTAERVLSRLVEGRLIAVSRRFGEAVDDSVVELGHESLVRNWRTLSRWIDEESDELRFLAEAEQAASLWVRRGRRTEELWSGDALREARQKAEQCAEALPQVVDEFLAAAANREGRRRRRQRIAVFGALSLSVLVAFGAVLVALVVSDKEQRARRSEQRAEDREIRAVVEAARAAYRSGRMLEARARLRGALERGAAPSSAARGLWWNLEREPLLWQQPLGSTVYSVALSPDGTRAAAGCQNGLVYVVDTRSRTTDVLRGHTDQVLTVGFGPRGRLLASGGWSGEVVLWDAQHQAALHVLRGSDKGVRSVAFDSEGALLAAGDYGREIRIWDVERGELRRVLRGHTGGVIDTAFGPGGMLASVSSDGTLRTWNAASGAPQKICTGHRDSVLSVAVSQGGELLATGGRDHTVRLWRADTCENVAVLRGHHGDVVSVRFARSDALLVSSERSGQVRLWNVGRRMVERVFDSGAKALWDIDVDPSGSRLVSGGADRLLRLWAVPRSSEPAVDTSHASSVWSVVFSPDDKRIVSAGNDGKIGVWDRGSGQLRAFLEGHLGPVRSVDASPMGDLIASGGEDRSVRLWAAGSGVELRLMSGHDAAVRAVAFSPDGSQLASGGLDDVVRLWDVPSGQLLRELRGHDAGIYALAFAPSGQVLASGGDDRTLRLWDVATGRLQASLAAGQSAFLGLSFGVTGHLLASTQLDGSVRLWTLDNRQERLVGRHPVRACGSAFQPNGRVVASSGARDRAMLWPLDEGEPVVLAGHEGDVNGVAFAAGGEVVATGGDDTTVRLWRATDGLPNWRAPVLLGSPPTLLSHRGWQRIDGEGGGFEESGRVPSLPPQLDRVLRTNARHAVRGEGEILCLQRFDGHLEAWDLQAGRRLVDRNVGRIDAVAALPGACATLSVGSVDLVTAVAPQQVQRLAEQVTALGTGAETLFVAKRHTVQTYRADGLPSSEFAVADGEVAAVGGDSTAADGGTSARSAYFAVGYRDGTVRVYAAAGDRQAASWMLEETAASRPTQVLPGPARTVFVGYANGVLGLWNVDDGSLVGKVRLHGRVVHLLRQGDWLYAATDLGHYWRTDIGALRVDRCAMLRDVWGAVPVIWRHGKAVLRPPPNDDPCAGRREENVAQ